MTLSLYDQLKDHPRFPYEHVLEHPSKESEAYCNGRESCYEQFIDFLKSVCVDEEKVNGLSAQSYGYEPNENKEVDSGLLIKIGELICQSNIIGDVDKGE
jgi:hypothetical protein